MTTPPWFRLGYVIPHLHTDMDAYQFYKVAPDGVMLVTTQLDLAEYSLAAVEAELPTLRSRVGLLAACGVDVVSLSGVPVAAALGRPRMLQLLTDVQETTGLRADTDLEAHIAALQHLGVARVAVATRWPQHVVDGMVAYLAAAGIQVVGVAARARDLGSNKRADPAADHDLALSLGRQAVESAAPSAQALMLPGGLWYAVAAAPLLEAELGIPVTLNITAALWSALTGDGRMLEHRPPPGSGRLLATL